MSRCLNARCRRWAGWICRVCKRPVCAQHSSNKRDNEATCTSCAIRQYRQAAR